MNLARVTRWWWIRHAPVKDLHLKLITGQSDVDADVSDVNQFKHLAGQLPTGAVWMASPLKRTHQTAEALGQAGAERGELNIIPDFSEQHFGDWTGQRWDQVGDQSEFWTDPANTTPPGTNAESFQTVCDRVAQTIHTLNTDHTGESGRDIICVAHAGVIRAAVVLALGLRPEQGLALDVRHTALTRLDHLGEDHWRVMGLNTGGNLS